MIKVMDSVLPSWARSIPSTQAERAGVLAGDVICEPSSTESNKKYISFDDFLETCRLGIRPVAFRVVREPGMTKKKAASKQAKAAAAESKQATAAAVQSKQGSVGQSKQGSASAEQSKQGSAEQSKQATAAEQSRQGSAAEQSKQGSAEQSKQATAAEQSKQASAEQSKQATAAEQSKQDSVPAPALAQVPAPAQRRLRHPLQLKCQHHRRLFLMWKKPTFQSVLVWSLMILKRIKRPPKRLEQRS